MNAVHNPLDDVQSFQIGSNSRKRKFAVLLGASADFTVTTTHFLLSRYVPTFFAEIIAKNGVSVEVGNPPKVCNGIPECAGWRWRSDRQNGTRQRRLGGEADECRVHYRWQL